MKSKATTKIGNKSSLFAKIKLPLIVYGIFFFYLVTLPQFVSLAIPCLRPFPGTSYSLHDCVVLKALDTYMILALAGFSLAVLTYFFLMKKKSLKPLLGVSLIMAIGIIIFYHLYIPQAEAQIRRAPILLEQEK